jgi:hypothetical protein
VRTDAAPPVQDLTAAAVGPAVSEPSHPGESPIIARGEVEDIARDITLDHGDAEPLIVREKLHKADLMTLDQALFEMELVGHDFYLFCDKETELPSVVYRRHAYDYGVIRLETTR